MKLLLICALFALIAINSVNSAIDCSHLIRKPAEGYWLEHTVNGKSHEEAAKLHNIDITDIQQADFDYCIDEIDEGLSKDIGKMEEVYNALKIDQMALIAEKNKFITRFDESHKKIRGTQMTKEVNSITTQIVGNIDVCVSNNIAHMTKIGKAVKKRLQDHNLVLTGKKGELEALVEEVEKSIKKVQKEMEECEGNKKAEFEIFEKKSKEAEDNINDVKKKIAETAATSKETLERLSKTCYENIELLIKEISKIFTQKTKRKAIVSKRGKMFLDEEDERFAKIKTKKFSKNELFLVKVAYFRLYLEAKILNLELEYKHLMKPFENKDAELSKIISDQAQIDGDTEVIKGKIDENMLFTFNKLSQKIGDEQKEVEEDVGKLNIDKVNLEKVIDYIEKNRAELLDQHGKKTEAQKKNCEKVAEDIENWKQILRGSLTAVQESQKILKEEEKELQALKEQDEKMNKYFETGFSSSIDDDKVNFGMAVKSVAQFLSGKVTAESSAASSLEILDSNQHRSKKDIINKAVYYCYSFITDDHKALINSLLKEPSTHKVAAEWFEIARDTGY